MISITCLKTFLYDLDSIFQHLNPLMILCMKTDLPCKNCIVSVRSGADLLRLLRKAINDYVNCCKADITTWAENLGLIIRSWYRYSVFYIASCGIVTEIFTSWNAKLPCQIVRDRPPDFPTSLLSLILFSISLHKLSSLSCLSSPHSPQ